MNTAIIEAIKNASNQAASNIVVSDKKESVNSDIQNNPVDQTSNEGLSTISIIGITITLQLILIFIALCLYHYFKKNNISQIQ